MLHAACLLRDRQTVSRSCAKRLIDYVVDADGTCERKKQSVERAGEEVVVCFKFSRVPRQERGG